MTGTTPSIEMLRRLLRLDDKSGVLYWRERTISMFGDSPRPEVSCKAWNTRFEGKKALNSKDKSGYLRGTIFGQHLKAHRVVFAIYHGQWPKADIDHINGARNDNRPENLRDASRSENMRNAPTRSDSTTGLMGVSFHRGAKKYRAHISVGGRFVHIGYFDTAEEAHRARLKANSIYGYHENHGRKAS